VRVDGVVVQSLKLLPNARGRLLEVQREDDPIFPGFGQVYVTSTLPGVVKAWYRHRRQIDQIAIVRGEIRLALFDDREASATYQAVQVVTMTEATPCLVQIPPGVWHGFQAVGDDEAFLLHLNSVAYDFERPDEDRLDPADPSVPYRWTRG
jgi:dTDP-4-dehydrorhamnose 3,5-epimerase